jgi:hypothetical protein
MASVGQGRLKFLSLHASGRSSAHTWVLDSMPGRFEGQSEVRTVCGEEGTGGTEEFLSRCLLAGQEAALALVRGRR